MHIGANEVRPKEIQKLLGKVEGTPQEALISRLALRSMKQVQIYAGELRTFWIGSELLYTFYLTDSSLPGSSDSSDHQR